VLVELSVMEQRYRAVLEVEAGCPVTEVAARHGVTRQSVHAWVRRYRAGGLAALADRSHRPASCPHQIPPGSKRCMRAAAVSSTLPSPLPPAARGRLHGAHLAGPPPPAPPAGITRVSRVVSSQGSLMVAGTKIHLGHAHRGKIVTVIVEDRQYRILHDGTPLAACPRAVIKEVTRRSASGHPSYEV
jgi:hypothetical protein